MLPFISVIMPVRNERGMLPKLIDELLRQNYPADRFEILVVDGRSTDGTADLVRRRYTNRQVRVQVLENPAIHASAGRNVGIRSAFGEVILFIDGHCTIPSRNLLEDTAAILAQTGAGCLCRPQPLLAPSDTHTGEVIAQVQGADAARDERICGFVDPVCGGATYRREVFTRVGLFDESFDACEEVDFNTRVRTANIRAYTDPRLAVHYQPRKDVRALFQQMLRLGRGRVRLMRKHADAISKGQLAPLAALAIAALTVTAWIALPRAAAEIVSIPLAVLIAGVLFASLRLGVRHGIGSAWKAPGIYAAMYCGLGLGLFFEMLTPSRSTAAPTLDAIQPTSLVEEAEEMERAA